MQRFLGILILSFLLGLGTEAFSESEPKSPLTLTIQSEKDVYGIGEPIMLTVQLRNISGTPLEVIDFDRAGEWLVRAQVLIFEFDCGIEAAVQYSGGMVDYFPGDITKRLAHGESMTATIVINGPDSLWAINGPAVCDVRVSYYDPLPYEDVGEIFPSKGASSNVLTVTIENGKLTKINVSPEDRMCQADTDCTVIYPSCVSGCDDPCGTPVNRDYLDKYHRLIDACRKEIPMEWCEQDADCRPVKCDSGTCRNQ